jgi:twitching motility protein PilT
MLPVLRVDGTLETQETIAISARELNEMSAALLDEAAQRRFAATGDVTVTHRDAGAGRVRVHAFRTGRGPALAMRLLANQIPDLDALGLPAITGTFCERSHGLVLLAGPTGSGKSTAAAALLDRINRTQTKHIVTIEDPIEYEHEAMRSLISQREVGRDAPSFSDALYGTLRCDPDVILVGEMRDAATMLAALTAAETGHLVLATLHTGDAPQTVDRIIGAFDGAMQDQIRTQLAQTLLSAVCLRLLPRAAGAGRVCAAEIMVATGAVRNLIREGRTHQLRNTIASGRQFGMQTLESHLSELVSRREIAPEAATGGQR